MTDVLVPRDPEGLDAVFELAYFDPPWVPGWARDQVHERYYTRFHEQQVKLLDSLFEQLEVLRAGPDFEGPTLIVWGRDDPVFPLAIGQRLADRLPSAERLVVDEARHAPHIEHPNEVNRALSAFLATAPSR